MRVPTTPATDTTDERDERHGPDRRWFLAVGAVLASAAIAMAAAAAMMPTDRQLEPVPAATAVRGGE